MREALQREGAKGGSPYAECVEPASESCMSSEMHWKKVQRMPALTAEEMGANSIN